MTPPGLRTKLRGKNALRVVLSFIAVITFFPSAADGQAVDSASSAPVEAAPASSLLLPLEGPPVSSGIFSRDEFGRATVRAVRLDGPLRIDGTLNEPIYTSVPPIPDFIQTEPKEGAPATERTDLWVMFDRDHVYVAFRCWETERSRVVANEMRRDSNAIWGGNDVVVFMFDTFYDRRNSVVFTVNAIGGRQDGQVTNERQYNGDWNPIWEVKTRRFDGGWTVEAALPFKSLRYRPGRDQIWGFNAMRTNRWKNEISLLSPGPAGRGQLGIQFASMAATLIGLKAPPGSRNIEIKPYATSSLKSERNAAGSFSNDGTGDAGLDVKYGITQNWTADFTYNTDFAQVEADEQQVNLTRFSLFFPEKREFFLENQGLFSFGGAGNMGGGGMGAGGGNAPILFYSRRIGLNEGRVVPIQAGGRLTGRFQRYSVGLLNIRTGEEPVSQTPPTTFTVARLKRDILRTSSVGLIVTGRSESGGEPGIGSKTTYGADAAFSFFRNLNINTYWARTRAGAVSSEDDTSYRTQLDYSGDRYGLQLDRLVVGANFNPEAGYVRRTDMRHNFGQVRFSPRPERIASIRKLSWSASMGYTENGAGRLETRELGGEFGIEFHNSDRFSVNYLRTYEFLPRPFRIAPGITLPVQGYDFGRTRVAFNLGQQRRMSAQFSVEHGGFYSGERTTFSVGRGRVNVAPRLSLEPTYSVNWVDLREGAFTTHLGGSRVTYTVTPMMFVSALLQYNSAANAISTNVRLRWEYRPGSELFIVYNEERDTLGTGFPEMANRALIIKVNRLFRF